MKLLLATHNEHKRGSSSACSPAQARASAGSSRRCPRTVILPPEDGETFAENALGQGARRGAGARAAEHRRRLGHRGRRARRRAGGALGALRGRAAQRDEENLAKLLREAPAGSALEYVCVIAYVDPRAATERVFEGRCAGRLAASRGASGGFGYDPAFLPDDGPAGRDDGRALGRAEGRDQPPRPRGPGAARVARRAPSYSRLIAADPATARPRPA